MTLEQVLADWREEATILRRAGHATEADLRERMARQVQDAAPDYLEWVTEADAMAISGRSAEFFRARFPTWERDGHARKRGRKREYRMVMVPRRANPSAAYEAGRRGAA